MEFYDLNFCNSVKDLNRTDNIKNDMEILQLKNKKKINILMSYNIKTEVECIKNKNDIKILNYKIIKNIIKLYFNKKEIKLGEKKIIDNLLNYKKFNTNKKIYKHKHDLNIIS